ncbi:hypothetical protein KM043_008507 [Ampulex compressa]|nr:hypothetical protein KM043_008507 [Ampulex compressa]
MNSFLKYKHYLWGVTAGVVIGCVQILPNTVFLDTYRYYFFKRRANANIEVPLKDDILQMYNEVVNDLKLSEDIKNLIKPFNASGYDVFHAGTISLKYGAIIGIPSIFEHVYPSDLERKYMKLNDEEIDWTKQEALNLLNSLILSKNAKKFAIAREILKLQDEESIWNFIVVPPILISMYPTYYLINHKFKLYATNPYKRWMAISAIIIFGAGLYLAWADYLSYKHDVKNDATLANLGLEYIKGGQEFYTKLLERNVALRGLMGKIGSEVYTVTGNDRFLFRLPYKPLTQKKMFFDANLESLNQPA